MSRENQNVHLRISIKGGALQYGIRAVSSKDPRLDFSIEIKHRAIGIQKYFCLCMYILSIK
jgi:hypothetical protein